MACLCLLVVAGARAEAALWPVALEPREDPLLPRSLAPTRSVGEVRRMVREGHPEVLAWCAALLDSPTPAARVLGLEGWRLAPYLPPEVRRQVERHLGDDEPGARLLAVDVLARHDLRPSWMVFAAMADDPAREVRLRAIRALGATHEARAVLVVMSARRDADREVRAAALTALGQSGDRRAAAFLRPFLDDPDALLRRTAVQALAALGDVTLVPTLKAWAEPVTPRAGPAHDDASRPELGAGALSPARLQTRVALLALGRLATDDALAFLVRLLRQPPHDPALTEALRLAGPRVLPLLHAEAAHGPAVSAVPALQVMAALRPEEPCRDADPSWVERETAIALTALRVWRPCADTPLRAALLPRLRALRSPAVKAALLELLADEAPEYPLTSVRARALAEALTNGLVDPASEVRSAALHAATRRPSLRAMVRASPAWPTLLDDDSPDVAEAALRLMGSSPRDGDAALLLAHPPRRELASTWRDTLELVANPEDLRPLDETLLRAGPGPVRDGALQAEARLNRERPLEARRTRVTARLLSWLVPGASSERGAGEDPAATARWTAKALALPDIPATVTSWAAALFAEAAPETRAALAEPLRNRWETGAAHALDEHGRSSPFRSPPTSLEVRVWERDGVRLVPATFVSLTLAEHAHEPSREATTDADGTWWCDGTACPSRERLQELRSAAGSLRLLPEHALDVPASGP